MDRRYTVKREFCGHRDPKWVVRFCGEWVGYKDARHDALALADEHKRKWNEDIERHLTH